MKKNIFVFTLLLSTYSAHPMERHLKRTVSFCPQTMQLAGILTGNDVNRAREIIDQLPESLVLQYDLFVRAQVPAIKAMILSQIKATLKEKIVKALPETSGITDLIHTFPQLSDPIIAHSHPTIDEQFLNMLTQLKNEIQALPTVQNNPFVAALAKHMPSAMEPETLVGLVARTLALKIFQKKSSSLERAALPQELRSRVELEYAQLVQEMRASNKASL